MPSRSRRPRRDDPLTAALGYFRDLGVREIHLPAAAASGPLAAGPVVPTASPADTPPTR